MIHNLIIRSETPSDYAAIARLHARAFGTGDVPAIVSLQRERPGFQPALSVIGEIDGAMAGHVLLMPETIRLMDQTVKAVVVSPVGVAPEFQRTGVGSALMREGHRIARELGYPISFLVGHPEYYPRFGYRTHVYGSSSLTVHKVDLPSAQILTVRLPVEADLPVLKALWQAEEGAIDFAIQPDDTLLGWLSPNGKLTCSVFERDGQIVGYARYHAGQTPSVALFASRDDDSARQMASFLCGDQETIALPLHPSSRSLSAFAGQPVHNSWEAAMVCALEPGALDIYFSALDSGARLPGRVIWPPAFDCTA